MSELTMAQIDEQIKNAPLSKEDAKRQFIETTEKLGIQHTFSFDDAWDYAVHQRKQKEFREKIAEFEQVVNAHPAKLQAVHKINPTKHSFADGQYIREIFNPAGLFIVTKIHNKAHPFFLMQGEMSIFSQDGIERISAPYHGITQAGTKRAIYTHTECVFVTVHATDKLNIEDIEEEVIAKSFEDVNLLPPNVEQVEKFICQIKEKQI
jgi:hypothetical protein|tara:strand:- start:102 stop:725 length:624 start_codon:yes stop_codon:yes gene_type:complete